jgi:cysteinyl-tRNA synthetase
VEEREGVNNQNEDVIRTRIEHRVRRYIRLSSSYEERVDSAKEALENHKEFMERIDRWTKEAKENEVVRQRLEMNRPNIEEYQRSHNEIVRLHCERFRELQDQIAELESQYPTLVESELAAQRAQLKPFVDQLCQDLRDEGIDRSTSTGLNTT